MTRYSFHFPLFQRTRISTVFTAQSTTMASVMPITPMCIKMGWVGGNFCPCIFAGAACGYGLAQLTQADPVLMVTIVVAVFLAGVLRKPVLAIALLLLFFPLNGIVWMGIAAVVGSLLPVPAFLLSEE